MHNYSSFNEAEDYPLEITTDLIHELVFLPFRKISSIRARQLTEEDYQEKLGVIHTLEGVEAFHPGDYLAVGVEGEEWPLLKESIERDYAFVEGLAKDGFSLYRPLSSIRQACQISCPFIVKSFNGDMYHGKPGDYVVYATTDHIHIVDHDIFERSYVRVFEDDSRS